VYATLRVRCNGSYHTFQGKRVHLMKIKKDSKGKNRHWFRWYQ